MRAEAEAEKRPLTIRSPWRDRDPEEAPAGVPPVIRLKAPREGETVIEDRVQGRVVFQNKDLDDLIILRSDGNPTYNLAVVVDDHDMGVTHVVRGVDHLTNAARQTQIYLGMGWDVPVWAHVPLIHGADGAKLSKRHGAQGVEEYRSMGYLPVALKNYLVRLGWSHGDDEIISPADLISWFDINDINKSASRFDFKKLDDLNGHYIRQTDDAELLARIKGMLPHLDFAALKAIPLDPKAPPRSDIQLAKEVESVLPGIATGTELAALFEKTGWDKLAAALPSLKERAKTLAELIGGALFIVASRPLKLDDKAAKIMDAEGRGVLGSLVARLDASSEWTAARARGRRAHVLGGDRRKARQGGPALARGADGAHGFAARVRCHGGAGARRGPGTASGSTCDGMTRNQARLAWNRSPRIVHRLILDWPFMRPMNGL